MLKTSALSPETAAYRAVIPAGEYWLKIIAKDQTFRIVDLQGNQAADTLFFSAADPAGRYSAVDTIREQGNVYLSTGTKLLSTECNVMLEIVADLVGQHDTLGGACATESKPRRRSTCRGGR